MKYIRAFQGMPSSSTKIKWGEKKGGTWSGGAECDLSLKGPKEKSKM